MLWLHRYDWKDKAISRISKAALFIVWTLLLLQLHGKVIRSRGSTHRWSVVIRYWYTVRRVRLVQVARVHAILWTVCICGSRTAASNLCVVQASSSWATFASAVSVVDGRLRHLSASVSVYTSLWWGGIDQASPVWCSFEFHPQIVKQEAQQRRGTARTSGVTKCTGLGLCI